MRRGNGDAATQVLPTGPCHPDPATWILPPGSCHLVFRDMRMGKPAMEAGGSSAEWREMGRERRWLVSASILHAECVRLSLELTAPICIASSRTSHTCRGSTAHRAAPSSRPAAREPSPCASGIAPDLASAQPSPHSSGSSIGESAPRSACSRARACRSSDTRPTSAAPADPPAASSSPWRPCDGKGRARLSLKARSAERSSSSLSWSNDLAGGPAEGGRSSGERGM